MIVTIYLAMQILASCLALDLWFPRISRKHHNGGLEQGMMKNFLIVALNGSSSTISDPRISKGVYREVSALHCDVVLSIEASCRRARRGTGRRLYGTKVNTGFVSSRTKPTPIGKKMQQLLKDWRQDAMHKHQYESAIYIGDKLLAITSKQVSLIRQSRELTSARRS